MRIRSSCTGGTHAHTGQWNMHTELTLTPTHPVLVNIPFMYAHVLRDYYIDDLPRRVRFQTINHGTMSFRRLVMRRTTSGTRTSYCIAVEDDWPF